MHFIEIPLLQYLRAPRCEPQRVDDAAALLMPTQEEEAHITQAKYRAWLLMSAAQVLSLLQHAGEDDSDLE